MPQPELEIDLPFPRTSGKVARLWDTVWLDDVEFPGKVDVRAAVARRVEARKARGRDGAQLTDQGLEPATVTLTFTAWKSDHFEALRDLIPRFAARQRLRDRKPLDIYHPALAPLGIARVYVTKVGNIVPGSTRGTWEMEVECMEYMPPPRRSVTRTVAATANGGGLAGVAHTEVQTNVAGDKSPRANGAADP
jgi:hypothetical protein